MRINTDDEVYRVDAVWLGPPRATFPWRARYQAYLIGLVIAVLIMFVQRVVGIEFGFFSVGWALLLTVVATRAVGRLVTSDRPFWPMLSSVVAETRTPRRPTRGLGGAVRTDRIQVREAAPALPAPDAPTPPKAPSSRGAIERSHQPHRRTR